MCRRSIWIVSSFVDALRQVDGWPCERVAVAVTGAAQATYGDAAARFTWASVTKLATAVANASPCARPTSSIDAASVT